MMRGIRMLDKAVKFLLDALMFAIEMEDREEEKSNPPLKVVSKGMIYHA